MDYKSIQWLVNAEGLQILRNYGTIRVTITKATTTATDRQGRTMFDNCWNLGIRYKLTTTRKNP